MSAYSTTAPQHCKLHNVNDTPSTGRNGHEYLLSNESLNPPLPATFAKQRLASVYFYFWWSWETMNIFISVLMSLFNSLFCDRLDNWGAFLITRNHETVELFLDWDIFSYGSFAQNFQFSTAAMLIIFILKILMLTIDQCTYLYSIFTGLGWFSSFSLKQISTWKLKITKTLVLGVHYNAKRLLEILLLVLINAIEL